WCTNYQPDEKRISHTEAGHLTPDVRIFPSGVPAPNVVLTCRYLVIADFGVDGRNLKQSTKNEPLLLLWLARMEANTSFAMRISGFSDCVGSRAKNLFLRTGRARNVFDLLGPSAKKRVFSSGPAPLDTYLVENTTVAGRAQNRAVVIAIHSHNPA